MSATVIGKVVNGKYVSLAPKGRDGIAEICAARQFPGLTGTDHNFLQGKMSGQQFDRMDPVSRRQLLQMAKRAGISTAGKVYVGALADKRLAGDPDSWVADTSDLLAVAKRKGKNLSGVVKYQAPEPPPKDPIVLAEPLVQRLMQAHLKQDPGKARNLKKLRLEVLDKHAPPHKKHLIKG